MRVEWSASAGADALALIEYVAEEDPAAASYLYAEIQHQIERLEDYPQMGRTGRVAGTRELVISRTAYVAVYRIISERVIVLRLLHGKQQWPPAQDL
ncbi:type II toxin-antitoxin system RelE/ParE family toxin [Tepidicaulis sp. LMO-SS28]|uniref:type II toxin-antitoxin system RelE/ParE family toxin n=1 Tax=Tepidicaulis sp. LMO-SS28 TaxID=3447455 RepID=UPI003EE35076